MFQVENVGRAMTFKAGNWYESSREVRKKYGEYWKGILVRGHDISVIFEYVGSRRKHYGDELDLERGLLKYVGEGKSGDQQLNARNKALVEAKKNGISITVFFDCGDVFSPKRLLCAGKWVVNSYRYVTVGSRKVFLFTLKPIDDEITKLMRFIFGAANAVNKSFERDLTAFSKARIRLYERHPDVVRSRDNIAGEIGEYFAVKVLNKALKCTPVIRLSANEKDIDAIQIGNGKTFAIKTIGKPYQSTSNIWSEEPGKHVNYFVIVYLDRDVLTPIYVLLVSARLASRYMKKDAYQGSKKLQVTPELVKRGKMLFGKAPSMAVTMRRGR